jgi:peptide/nickel transport system substrate-binding protein
MARKKTVWIALLMVFAIMAAACSTSKPSQPSTEPPKPAAPKILTIGMFSSPESFIPIASKTSYNNLIIGLIYPSLVTMNEKLEFVGNLAETFTVSPDQTVFTFKLHKNAKWSDGKPITAEDVAYTYQVIAHPDTPTSRRSLIDTIKGLDKNGISETKDLNVAGIKVIDANTIEFTTKAPVDKDAFLEKVGQISLMPKSVLSSVTNLKELDKADFNLKPTVFGGPYRLVTYVTDSHVELAPNPDYFLGKPKLDKLFVKIVNQKIISAALQAGEVDVTAGAGIGEVPIADWETISKLPNMTPVTYVAQSYQYLDFNIAKPEFASAKVRQAFAQAINRPLIVQRLLKGEGEVINTPLNSANKYYLKNLQTGLEYNKDKAKQMLTEAGWDFNKEVVLLTPTGNTVREQSADIIMANLQDAGVKVKIEKVDFTTRQARSAKGDFQLSLVGFSATFDPDFSSQVMTGSVYNDRKYSNQEFDDLFAKGKLTVKFEDKMKLYQQAQELFIKELPFLPLYSTKALNVVNKRALNVKMGPQGLTWNAQEWDIKQ